MIHPRPRSRPADNSAIWIVAVPALYVGVTLALLGRLVYSLRSLRQIAQRSHSIPDLDFRNLMHEIWLNSGGFTRPRLVCSSHVSSPVTFDSDGSWILLPSSWRHWEQAKLRAVLAHEMAHVERGDAQNLLLASLATCLFWFHPLSWFLWRRLSALAEEACDERVIASETTPEKYAQFLIDFACDVKRAHGRLAAGAIAMSGKSSLKRRIERLFAETSYLQHGRKAFAAVALAVIVPALYVSAAARPDQPYEKETSKGQKSPLWLQATSLSPADAAKIQSALQANPEDLDSRMELLMYFGLNGQGKPFETQMLWFIKQHPSFGTLKLAQAAMLRPWQQLGDESRAQIAAAWEQAIAEHAGSPAVLDNAAAFFETFGSDRSLTLLREAEALDPVHREKYDEGIVICYAAAEIQVFHPAEQINNIRLTDRTAANLREQLALSNDPELLAETGRVLVRSSRMDNGGPQFQRGIELIQRAIQLDPSNSKWPATLEWAEAEPQRQLNYDRLTKRESLPTGAVQIGSKVAEASVLTETEPVYPPLARQVRLQGTVEFTVTVGADGKVQHLTLVRGHPLLVQAAKDAVTKYVYQPVLLEGKAVPFVTEVLVPFRLD